MISPPQGGGWGGGGYRCWVEQRGSLPGKTARDRRCQCVQNATCSVHEGSTSLLSCQQFTSQGRKSVANWCMWRLTWALKTSTSLDILRATLLLTSLLWLWFFLFGATLSAWFCHLCAFLPSCGSFESPAAIGLIAQKMRLMQSMMHAGKGEARREGRTVGNLRWVEGCVGTEQGSEDRRDEHSAPEWQILECSVRRG